MVTQDKLTILRMYEENKTLASIGEVFNVSRQRIWQIVKRTRQNDIPRIKKAGASGSVNPRPSEEYIARKLRRKGYSVKHMPYNAPFDLLVDQFRVEVKHRENSKLLNNSNYFSFNELCAREPIDFYIFICGKLYLPKIYLIGAKKVKNHLHIPLFSKYSTKWDWKKIEGKLDLNKPIEIKI